MAFMIGAWCEHVHVLEHVMYLVDIGFSLHVQNDLARNKPGYLHRPSQNERLVCGPIVTHPVCQATDDLYKKHADLLVGHL